MLARGAFAYRFAVTTTVSLPYDAVETVTVAVHGFIFFIMVNGAVVFADGLARVAGVAAVSAVVVAWLRRAFR